MIFEYKTDFMRSVQNLVARGFTHYTTGIVEKTKYNAVYEKLKTQYETEMTTQQRWRARKKGFAVTHLLAFVLNDEEIFFILLATAGQGDIHEFEKLKDVSKKQERIEITGYELLKMPRKGAQPAWTWRMTDNTFNFWRKRLKRAIRWKSKRFINQCVYSLSRLPKFHAIRQQAYKLIQFAKADWKRTFKNSEPCPFDSIFLGFYGRYQTAKKIEASELKKYSVKRL